MRVFRACIRPRAERSVDLVEQVALSALRSILESAVFDLSEALSTGRTRRRDKKVMPDSSKVFGLFASD